MRGKDTGGGLNLPVAGITPACAGKRPAGGHHRAGPRDHPRVCGEKRSGSCRILTRSGSPPRMRGKDKFHTTIQRTVRITPACAGKSAYRRACDSLGWDHPRACGEKCAGALKNSLSTGSPPRMRGKENYAKLHGLTIGITPAHAGKRFFYFSLAVVTQDHPRACGEKMISNGSSTPTKGSPPRMRGKDHAVHHRIDCVGITPAHAGKRFARRGSHLFRGDHPRACGEKII